MRIRAKFSKIGRIKYVGHLDIMRLFQRAIRVADLPICYSQGFSPHSLVYFALPLPVGMMSEGEYMDMLLEQPMAPSEIKERLQKALAEGLTILDVYEVDEKAPSLMSLVQGADYQIKLKNCPNLREIEEKFNRSEQLFVTKKSKKGMIEVDIKPLVLKSDFRENEITIQVYAGSTQNLSPELFLKALFNEEQPEAQIIRKELYTFDKDVLVAIDKVGRINE